MRTKASNGDTKPLNLRSKLWDARTKPCEDAAIAYYAALNNLSRTYASQDLKEITSDHTSPITSSGRGSHKVWVRRLS